MDIIKTENLCYSYDDKKALDNVNITIPQNKITAILGGNGAGKSTLFLSLNGVLSPTSGKIFFCGEEIPKNQKKARKLTQKIGVVFQDPNDQLFSDSVKNDIVFGAINMGLPKDEIADKLDVIARQTGVVELLEKPTHALSFGQKKRVAIAGVLMMSPEVIILDEPTAGLDPQGVSDILNLLLELKNNSNITIILSTHEIDLVPLYCDFVYVLNQGEVVLAKPTKTAFADADLLRKLNLRTPRIMHLMEILHKKDNMDVDCSAATISQGRATIKEMFDKK